MIILVADDNTLSRDLIREPLEGSGPVADKFWFQQISLYRTTLIDLYAQRPSTFEINHNVMFYSHIHRNPTAPAVSVEGGDADTEIRSGGAGTACSVPSERKR
jgi:hypothetical protein